MGRTTLFLPLALLFLASVIPSKAQKAEAVSAGAGEESRVTVAAGAPLTVECRLRPEQRAEWRRDGAVPPPDMSVAPEAAAGERLSARLQAAAARAQHAGLYTCSRERDHRVRVVVLPAARAAESATVGAVAAAAPAAAPAPVDSEDLPEVLYDVRGNLSLHCGLSNEFNVAYLWSKNGTALEAVWELAGRVQLERGGAELRLARALEDDFGNYSCALAGREGRQAWAVRGRPHVKLPANTNAVEGQKLKLVCKVIGKPYPAVSWSYSNSSDEEANFTDVSVALGGRALLSDSEQGVPGAALQLDAAARHDAGRFRCSAPHAAAPATTVLRVKDMYAALWPFLGICAEVFVLCAIILVYEKRRTKPELDDSDTDNHDQKKS